LLTDRPPFRVLPGQLPEQAGIEMVSCFKEIDRCPDKVSITWAALMLQLKLTEDDPVNVAGSQLSADMDNGSGGGHCNAYHHRRHICEVILCGQYLAMLRHESRLAMAQLALAALIHDYGHDGKLNGHEPFRLERESLRLSIPALKAAGIPKGVRDRIAAMVLSTDRHRGYPFALACHAARHAELAGLHVHGHPKLPVPEGGLELRILQHDPDAVNQALLLCEADVLPSLALTIDYSLALQKELSTEWGVDLGSQDKLRFLDDWLARSCKSNFFRPNALQLRHELDCGSRPRAAARNSSV
jgi:predicted metal-dependent HD superfamily phosphohydrolase